MIEIKCPACDKQTVVPDEEAGKKITCPCGNVNVVPHPAPAPGPESPGVVYQGKPSQLQNLWVFLGLVVVIVVALWPLRQALASVFKTSKSCALYGSPVRFAPNTNAPIRVRLA